MVIYRKKIADATPAELTQIREAKADYDKIYREIKSAERKAYKSDPNNRARWNAMNRAKYRAKNPNLRTPAAPLEIRQSRLRASYRKYQAKKSKDPGWRIGRNIKRRMLMALEGQPVPVKIMRLLGCSAEELKKHLEMQFKPGMTWENYGRGGWWLDHIKPCALFDFTKQEHREECFHYTNLQPLWQRENILKRDKLPDGTYARHRRVSALQVAA